MGLLNPKTDFGIVPNRQTYVQFLNFNTMKKYLFIAIVAIAGLTTSCTTDNDVFPTSKTNPKVQEFDYTLIQKEGDTLGEGDTGGQGGSTPIKP
ncbi:MAG: hypothetical protein ACJAYP_000226 [Flavobacterium sp.]